MADIYGDSATMRFFAEGDAWDAARIRATIEAMTQAYEHLSFGVWPVLVKESGSIIGACGLRKSAEGEPIELTAVFGRAYWGCGYAGEAAAAVLDFGFREIGLREIVALVDREDMRGIALINRLEMRYDRVVRAYRRDLMRYVKNGP